MFANKLLLLGVLLCIVPSALSCSAPATNYRPHISISLAKIITAKDVKPDDETELCDGSGWITHGDGHKTECPGCSACQDKLKPKPDITKTCKCNTRSTRCNCVKTYGIGMVREWKMNLNNNGGCYDD